MDIAKLNLSSPQIAVQSAYRDKRPVQRQIQPSTSCRWLDFNTFCINDTAFPMLEELEIFTLTATPTNSDAETRLNWLRQKQFDEISLQFRATWDMYLKFYTVFLTFNITALGLTIQYMSGVNRAPIVIAFLLQNVNSMVTALRIGQFSRTMTARQQRICNELLPDERSLERPAAIHDWTHLTDSSLPGELGYWGGVANAMGHGLLIACWLSLFFL